MKDSKITEQEFITNLLLRFKLTFPEVPYKYQQIGNTYFLRVGIENPDITESFLDFVMSAYDDFSLFQSDSLLCITDKDPIVDLNNPTQFNLKVEIDTVSTVEIKSDASINEKANQIALAA